MKNYISEGRAIYEDENHGLFSKSLAEWAVSKMMKRDEVTGRMKAIEPTGIEEVKTAMGSIGSTLPEQFLYTEYYLFNMAKADYPNTLQTDKQRAMFVEETLNDPDSCPESVLACFVAKMELKGEPIFWEKRL